MSQNRLPFRVEKHGDQALVAMNFEGLVRARNMPSSLLSKLGDLCKRMKVRARQVLTPDLKVPEYPKYRTLLDCDVYGMCTVELGVHTVKGKVEHVIAFYDAGNRTPVLILAEEQIEEFIELAK